MWKEQKNRITEMIVERTDSELETSRISIRRVQSKLGQHKYGRTRFARSERARRVHVASPSVCTSTGSSYMTDPYGLSFHIIFLLMNFNLYFAYVSSSRTLAGAWVLPFFADREPVKQHFKQARRLRALQQRLDPVQNFDDVYLQRLQKMLCQRTLKVFMRYSKRLRQLPIIKHFDIRDAELL